jgi:hypothetical protein
MARRGNISKRNATVALTMLLTGCTKERLAGFTAEGLAASYNVPAAKAEELLDRARQGRLL